MSTCGKALVWVCHLFVAVVLRSMQLDLSASRNSIMTDEMTGQYMLCVQDRAKHIKDMC